MIGLNLLKRLGGALVNDHRQISYAQCGEDLIMWHLCARLGIAQPTYLDIGAHHPTLLSNTYLFYTQGAHGVCVEPNPDLHRNIQRVRQRDTCLNIGIAVGKADKLRFYVLDDPVLSSFSNAVLQEQLAKGRKLIREIDVEVQSINAVIAKHLSPQPNLVSLDTEGFDLEILQSLDFSRHRPEVFCVETLTNVGDHKIDAIRDFMLAQGYLVFADTFINTIFVEKNRWLARPV